MTVGMKITLGTESTPEEAIAEFRRLAIEQGVSWIEGSERAEYEIEFGKPVDKWVATKITRPSFFSAVASEYTKVEETRIIGKRWTVLADEPPERIVWDGAPASWMAVTLDGRNPAIPER